MHHPHADPLELQRRAPLARNHVECRLGDRVRIRETWKHGADLDGAELGRHDRDALVLAGAYEGQEGPDELHGVDRVEGEFLDEFIEVHLLEGGEGLVNDACVTDEVVEAVGEEFGCLFGCLSDAGWGGDVEGHDAEAVGRVLGREALEALGALDVASRGDDEGGGVFELIRC